MKNNPKISIIIPVYNSSNQLRKTVQSICNQNYENYEILLVNDGSSNLSATKLYETLEQDFENVKLINNKNQGVVRSRIDGINHANGEYIIFSDHDDIYLKNSFSKLINAAIISNGDIVVANAFSRKISWVPLNERQLGIYSYKLMERKDFLKKEYLNFFGYNQFPVATWGKLYKTSILKTIKWDIYNYNFCDDIILNIQIFYNAQKIEFLPNIVYSHNYGGITSNSNISTLLNGYADVYKLKSKFLDLSNNIENKKFIFIELKNILYQGIYNFFLDSNQDESALRIELIKFKKSSAFHDLYIFYDKKDELINLMNDDDYDSIIKMGRNHFKENYLRIKGKNLFKNIIKLLT